jgi:hypothetical protein
MLFSYINTKNQCAASFACDQLIGIVWTLKDKCIGSFKLPHDFHNNLAKCHISWENKQNLKTYLPN